LAGERWCALQSISRWLSLAQEARRLSEFRIPRSSAIPVRLPVGGQIAAITEQARRRADRRRGGLGKSMMATALAKVFEDDYHTET